MRKKVLAKMSLLTFVIVLPLIASATIQNIIISPKINKNSTTSESLFDSSSPYNQATLNCALETNSAEIDSELMSTGDYNFFEKPELNIGLPNSYTTKINVTEIQIINQSSTNNKYGNVVVPSSQWYNYKQNKISKYITSAPFDTILFTNINYDFSNVNVEKRPKGDTNGDWQKCIAMSSDGNKMIVGEVGGRLWYSSDMGITWTETRPKGDASGNWYDVAMNAEGTYMLVVDRGGYVYCTKNSGQSWEQSNPHAYTDSWTSVALSADKRAVTGDGDGLWYFTTRGGSHWELKQPDGNRYYNFECVAMSEDGYCIIAGEYCNKLFLSGDGLGGSWREIRPNGQPGTHPWKSLAMSPDGTKILAAQIGQRLWYSSDPARMHQTTWVEVRPKGDTSGAWSDVAISPDGARLLASDIEGRLYFSTDLGSTWTELRPKGDTNGNWGGVAMRGEGNNILAGESSGRLWNCKRLEQSLPFQSVRIENLKYSVLGIDYTQAINLAYNSSASNYVPFKYTDVFCSYYFSSSVLNGYSRTSDLTIPTQNISLTWTFWFPELIFAFSTNISHDVHQYKKPSDINLKVNEDYVTDVESKYNNAGNVLLSEPPTILSISASLKVYFKLSISVEFSLTFDLELVQASYLEKSFIIQSDHSITIKNIDLNATSYIAKIYLNNLDLGNSNPNILAEPIEIDQYEKSKLEVILNQIPSEWPFYCETENQINFAFISIGSGIGLIVIQTDIIMQKIININLGGEYTIKGMVGNEILNMTENSSLLNITNCQSLILQDLMFNTYTLDYNKILIYIEEQNDNQITLLNNIFYLKSNLGNILSIKSNNILIKQCKFDNSTTGIALENAQNCIFHRNIFSNNTRGIELKSTTYDNLIYKNYFINNDLHAIDNGVNNRWNNMYIGNYWDNYTGLDENEDGIGDTKYEHIAGTANVNDSKPISDDLAPVFHEGQRISIDGLESTGINSWHFASTRDWCNGLGTLSEPYEIEGLAIDGGGIEGGSCIIVKTNRKYFQIKGCKLSNSDCENAFDAGITLDDVYYATINDNELFNNLGSGIYMSSCCYLKISSNEITGNSKSGINVRSTQSLQSKSLNVSNNEIFGNVEHGIYFHGYIDYDHPENNKYVSEAEICYNRMKYNGKTGIKIEVGEDIKGYKNKIFKSAQEGVYIDSNCKSCKTIGNALDQNGGTIKDLGVNDEIHHNAIEGKVESITIDDSDFGDFTWNKAVEQLAWVSKNGAYIFSGVEVASETGWAALTIANSAEPFEITNSIFSSALKDAGLTILKSEHGYVYNCISDNNLQGILLDHSNFTSVIDCHFVGNTKGIVENDCHDNKFVNNLIINSDDLDNFGLSSNSDNSNEDNSEKKQKNNAIVLIMSIVGACSGTGILSAYGIRKAKQTKAKKTQAMEFAIKHNLVDDGVREELPTDFDFLEGGASSTVTLDEDK